MAVTMGFTKSRWLLQHAVLISCGLICKVDGSSMAFKERALLPSAHTAFRVAGCFSLQRLLMPLLVVYVVHAAVRIHPATKMYFGRTGFSDRWNVYGGFLIAILAMVLRQRFYPNPELRLITHGSMGIDLLLTVAIFWLFHQSVHIVEPKIHMLMNQRRPEGVPTSLKYKIFVPTEESGEYVTSGNTTCVGTLSKPVRIGVVYATHRQSGSCYTEGIILRLRDTAKKLFDATTFIYRGGNDVFPDIELTLDNVDTNAVNALYQGKCRDRWGSHMFVGRDHVLVVIAQRRYCSLHSWMEARMKPTKPTTDKSSGLQAPPMATESTNVSSELQARIAIESTNISSEVQARMGMATKSTNISTVANLSLSTVQDNAVELSFDELDKMFDISEAQKTAVKKQALQLRLIKDE
eukprot:GHVQ01030414.1.p1 GENE.GHVQ01030414.1~~GHVQ01030414.1.p1  ORF type:complete len:408 (+),score=34.72 GHVQ01030414.1:803-2026(+)